jgi:hypothetical protein
MPASRSVKGGTHVPTGVSYMRRVGWCVVILMLILPGAARVAYGTPLVLFVATFDSDPGLPADAFSQTLAGVQFDFTFTSEGDGGGGAGFAFDPNYGEEDSSSINLLSGSLNLVTEERVTITRQDGQDFVFISLYVNNTALGETVVVGGYNDGDLVGTAQTMVNGDAGTLTFNELIVDEVRITSTDFANTNIDSFTGDTAVPTAVTLSKLQARGTSSAGLPVVLLLLGITFTLVVLFEKRFKVKAD